MKKKFNFEKGKIENEYEVGDLVDIEKLGGLFLSEEQDKKLDDIAKQLWLIFTDESPLEPERRKILIDVLEFKLELIDRPETYGI